MKKVFISYPCNDKQAQAFAHFLREHLPAFGAEAIDIFMDESIQPGDEWRSSLTAAINRCSMFICFASEMNPNVMFELGYALGKNKQILLVGDSRSIPADLQQMVYIPRESHPYDVLAQIQKSLSSFEERRPYLGLDPQSPKPSIGTLIERPDLLDSLEGLELEELVKEWFVKKGYHVSGDDVAHDRGFDFMVAPFRDGNAAVEVKKYRTTSRVPVAVVRQLLGSLVAERIPVGIVISSAPYTESAIFFAREVAPTILLWTLHDLVKMNEMPNKRVELMGDPRRGPPNAHP